MEDKAKVDPSQYDSGGFKVGELAKDHVDEEPKITAQDIVCKSGGFTEKDSENKEDANEITPNEVKSGGFKPTPGDPFSTDKEVHVETNKEMPIEANKEPMETNNEPTRSDKGVKTEEHAQASGAVTLSSKDAMKRVRLARNQFTLNRLLLMLMDVRPDSLSAETIKDLKMVYALLIKVYAEQASS